jgi:NOL1/NOP2/sun family putative RNA methylase
MTDIFIRYADIIPEYSLFKQSLKRPLTTHLRINTLKSDTATLLKSLREKGVPLERAFSSDNTLFSAPALDFPGNLLEYFLGYIHPQALTSCVASLVLAPERGAYVLDMCASPGGKCSHMAQLMENTGLIIANELYPSRHIPLGHTLDRLGVLNTVVTSYQAQEFPLRQRFDYVLADVPCSAEGIYRRITASHAYRENAAKAKLPDLQRKMILRGFDLLKPGGEMLYSTCTYNPEENESVVDFLLKERESVLLPIEVEIPFDPGITEWKDRRYERELAKAGRFYPHRINSVGFFMARIGRRK